MPKTIQVDATAPQQIIVCDPAEEVTIIAPQNPSNGDRFTVRTRTADLTPLLLQWNGDGFETTTGEDTYLFWPFSVAKFVYAANIQGIPGVTSRWVVDGVVPPDLPSLSLVTPVIPSASLGGTYQDLQFQEQKQNTYMGFENLTDFYFEIPGLYAITFNLAFEHNSSNSGRTTNIRLWNNTTSESAGVYPVGTGRNSEITNASIAFLANITVQDVINRNNFRFQIGGGDSYSQVAANSGAATILAHNLTPYVQVPVVTYTLGKTNVGTVGPTNLTQDNLWLTGPFTASNSGSLDNIYLYTNNSGVNVKLCIYDDLAGSPNVLIASTDELVSEAGGWISAAITGNIVAGKSYWIGWLHDTTTLSMAYDASLTTKYVARDYDLGFPDPHSGGSANLSREYPAYVEYSG